MLMGIDGGNNEVKVATKNGTFCFDSCIGEYRERKLITEYQDEMIVEWGDRKYFMGELAEKESNFPRRSQGLTKANQDVLIRILVAVHRFGSSSNKIVVGQPIEKHIPEEKEKIINMLKGKHTLTLNDETKTFYIEDVRVASEGASSWFGWFKQSPNFRIIDCGSGTVNIATIRDWNFNDRESFTMKVGTRTTDIITPEELVDSIISRTTAFFEQNDLILLVGGIAPVVYEQIKSFYPNTITFENSKFANAMGFFNIARSVYND